MRLVDWRDISIKKSIIDQISRLEGHFHREEYY